MESFFGNTKHTSLSLMESLYWVVNPVCSNKQGIQSDAFTVSDSNKGFYMGFRLINSMFIPNQIMKWNVFLLFLEEPQMKKRLKLFQNERLLSIWSLRRAYLSQCLSDKMMLQKRFSARMRLPTFGKVLPPPLFNLQLNREKQFSVDFPRHQERLSLWLVGDSVKALCGRLILRLD